MTEPSSPCIKICTMDPSGAYCLGCYRTLDEIGQWSRMSEPQRGRIMDRLPARKACLSAATDPTGVSWASD